MERVKRLLAVAMLLCACVVLHGQSRAELLPFVNRSTSGSVTSVTDGDTVRVRLDDGRSISVRLDGIDAPETSEPFSTAARNAVRVLLFDKRVQVNGTDVDRYDRLVARVVVNGQDSSLELVSAGLACHFTRYSSDPVLAGAEREARNAGRGFWAAGAQKPACVTNAAVTPRQAVPQTAIPQTSAPRSAAPRATPRAAIAGPYHGNRNSHVYHAPSCRNYNCPNCTVAFQSAADAERAGFRPAGDCLR